MRKLEGGVCHATIASLAVSPDERWLAACEGMDAHKPVKEPIRVWDLHDLTKPPQSVRATGAYYIKFGPDGRQLFYLASGGGVSFQPFPGVGKPKRIFKNEFISSFAFTPDGAKLIAGGNRAFGWDLAADSAFDVAMEGLDFTIDKYFVAAAILDVNCTTLRPDGAALAAVVNERVGNTDDRRLTMQVYSYPAGKLLAKSKPFVPSTESLTRLQDVRRVSYSPDGRWLAGLRWHDVVVWDAETLNEIATLQPSGAHHRYQMNAASIVCLAFTPDGRRLAVGCRGDADDHKFGLGEAKTSFFDTKTWEKLPDLNCQCDMVYALTFCRDGRLIAATDFVPTIWDAGEF